MNRRDLRWNFGAAVIDAAGWGVGMGLISPLTILPLFVAQLTRSEVAIGLITASQAFGWLVPGILVSAWLERQPRVKHSVMWIAMLERVMLLLMAPLCLWLGPHHRPALLVAFFSCWFVMNTAMGANMPGYYKLIAKTIPAEYRGRLYGVGGAVSGLLGLGTSALAAWALGKWGYPGAYAFCFLGAFIAQTVTVIPLGLMKEPVQAPEAAPEHRAGWKELRLVKEDPRLLWLTAALAFFSFNQVAAAFYTTYAVFRFHATPETVAEFTGAVMGSKTVAFLLAGFLSDRFGNRAAIQVATLAGVAAAATAWGAPDLRWMYLAFGLNEIAVQGWGVCSSNYVLELCPPERSGTYTAVYGVLSGPFRVLLPLAGGVLIAWLGYQQVFAVAVAGGIFATLLLLTRVVEPRRG